MYNLDYLQKRREAIRKNKGTDLFCLECFQANPLTTSQCMFCDTPPVGNREEALTAIEEQIQEARSRMNRPPKKDHSWKGSVLPGYEYHPSDEDVKVYVDGSLVFTGPPKRARKFLRSRGLSITDGVKDGQEWYIITQ